MFDPGACMQALLSGRGSAMLAPAEQKVYIDVLRIATLELTLSFMPAPFQPDPGKAVAGGRGGTDATCVHPSHACWRTASAQEHARFHPCHAMPQL